MKRYIAQLVFLPLVIAFSNEPDSSQSAFTILFPKSAEIAVGSDLHYILGFVDTSRVGAIEAKNYVESSTEFKVDPITLGYVFAQEVRNFFTERFLLTFIEFSSIYEKDSTRNRSLKLGFKKQNGIDLQIFWKSSDFFRFYKAARLDSGATFMKIRAEGYFLNWLEIESIANKEKYKDFFVFKINLNRGKNTVIIRALDFERNELQSVELNYVFATDIDMDINIPSGYKREYYHTPDAANLCSDCHRMEFSSKELGDINAVSGVCYSCHSWLMTDSYQHGPSTAWNCLYCHNEESRWTQYSTPGEEYDAGLCFECHITMKKKIENHEYMHMPVEMEQCSLCHDPHGSPNRYQLRKPVNQLCRGCHGSDYFKNHPAKNHPVEGKRNPLNPLKSMSCISCHNPHYGDHQYFFQHAKRKMELCQKCHQK